MKNFEGSSFLVSVAELLGEPQNSLFHPRLLYVFRRRLARDDVIALAPQ